MELIKNYLDAMAKSRQQLEDIIRYSNDTESEKKNEERCKKRITEIDEVILKIIEKQNLNNGHK